MKKSKQKQAYFHVIFALLLSIFLTSCEEKSKLETKAEISKNTIVDEDVKKYWYNGLAEITSYELTQQRYGEDRKGKAVLIYVTEDFDAQELVKADQKKEGNFPVLKLNSTKDFTTGIYPYHIIQSSFLPMQANEKIAKVSASIQEWCGQSYMQIEQRDELEVSIHSYFQKIGNTNFNIKSELTENGIWNKLRLFPGKIQTGELQMIPSLEYLRLFNLPVEAYQANVSQEKITSQMVTKIEYVDLKRALTITQDAQFPYSIESWEETWTKQDSSYTTKATKIKQIRIDYWNKNQNKHHFLRDTLQL
jgi:uncharacterized protein YaaQ